MFETSVRVSGIQAGEISRDDMQRLASIWYVNAIPATDVASAFEFLSGLFSESMARLETIYLPSKEIGQKFSDDFEIEERGPQEISFDEEV